VLFPSILRTVVPLVAGWIIVALTGLGFSLNSNTAQAAVTLAAAGTYYVVFRLVERAAEKFGGPVWLRGTVGALLGYARPPHYKPTDDVAELIRQSRT
jgi:RsiW-degrading membrane proteinase PrsW (M82 family)